MGSWGGGGRSRIESAEESLGFVPLWKELKGKLPGSPCWVPLPDPRHHLSWMEHSLPCGNSLGKSNSPTLCIPSHPRAYNLLRSTARGRSLNALRLYPDTPLGPSAGRSLLWCPAWSWPPQHPGPAESATSCELLIVPNKLLNATQRQHLTQAWTRAFSDLPNT